MAFNNLTDAESERLALLIEELGECIQAASKILRHGYNRNHPDGGLANRDSLTKEIAHVECAIRIMLDSKDISFSDKLRFLNKKEEEVGQWMHCQS